MAGLRARALHLVQIQPAREPVQFEQHRRREEDQADAKVFFVKMENQDSIDMSCGRYAGARVLPNGIRKNGQRTKCRGVS